MHLHCIRFYPCIWCFNTIPILNPRTVKTHNPLMGRLNNHFALHICTNLLQFAQNCASIHNLWICPFSPMNKVCLGTQLIHALASFMRSLLCHICNNCICVFLQDVVTNPQAVDRAVLLSVSFPRQRARCPSRTDRSLRHGRRRRHSLLHHLGQSQRVQLCHILLFCYTTSMTLSSSHHWSNFASLKGLFLQYFTAA